MQDIKDKILVVDDEGTSIITRIGEEIRF